jgi:hypothetical protein
VRKVINDQNIELQISHKRKQVHSALRLKKFVDLANSKFLDEKERQKISSNGNDNELILDRRGNEALEKQEKKQREENLNCH